jgi:AsmA protein
MNKFIKRMLIGGLGLLALIIIALLIIPFFVDLNRYKPYMEEKVSEATGRSFHIGSDLKLSLFPWAGVSCSDIKLGNPQGFEEKSFVTIESFEIRVKLLSLLSKHLEVQKFILNEPQIKLIKRSDGRVNWEFSSIAAAPSDSPPEKASPPPADVSGEIEAPASKLPIEKLAVGDFRIIKGHVIYHDQATGTRKAVDDFNLSLKDVSFDKPIQFDMSARMDNHPVALKGAFGPLGNDPGHGVIPVDMRLNAIEQLTVAIEGTITDPIASPEIDLALTVSPFSLKKVMNAVLPQQPVKTSDPDALEKIAINAHLKGNPGKVSVTEGALDIDETNLAFSLNASQFDRPNLKFNVELDRIDLNRYLPPKAASEKTAGQEPVGKSKDQSGTKPKKAPPEASKTDYAPLRRMVLDGQFKAGTLMIDKSTIEDIQLAVKAKNGEFRIDPFSLGAYQGTIAGSGVVNVNGSVPTSGIDLRISGLQISPLVKEQIDKDIIEGTTNADIKLKFVGDEADMIKRNLNGTGQLTLNDGAIVGVDLAAMARNVKSAFGLGAPSGQRPRTDFTELLIPFSIKNGMVTTSPTRLKSPFLRVVVAGKADLVKETLDFRIEPKVVGTIKGQGDEAERSGIMVPVLVTGSFEKPQFKPDLKAIAQQQIEKEVFEKKEVKEFIEKQGLQQYEEPAKKLLKDFLKD